MIQSIVRAVPVVEMLLEAALLAAFMMSAAAFATLLEHPDSPVRQAIGGGDCRRVLMGLAMGSTAAVLIYSPAGRRSGAHMNPAVTLAFLRLGRIAPSAAAGYACAQFAGGIAGMQLAHAVLGDALTHPAVGFVTTVPGPAGRLAAFAAEFAISYVLMRVVLRLVGSTRPWLTGLAAAALVAVWIGLEAPVSGMSMNPARTFGSALAAGRFDDLWIYFTAPVLGMLAAADPLVPREAGRAPCPKLVHDAQARCVFCRVRPCSPRPQLPSTQETIR